ncbi:TolC family protein [bacterium SCSIO 12741]|nr:TolC family protein [bacterium SCSIO 12741]
MKQSLIVGLLSLLVFSGQAQIVGLDQVMQLALEHNHNIRVFQNNVLIAENNADRGNAGQLPTVNLQGGANYSNNNTKLELLGVPEPIEVNGAESFNYNGSVGVNWTIFDGMAMFKNYKKLVLMYDLENVKTRASVEATLIQVVNTYYLAANAANNVEVARQSVQISQDRTNRAEAKFESGGSSSIDYLSAKVDLNSDSVTLANAEAQLLQFSEQLNMLTGYKLPSKFEIDMDVDIVETMSLEELEKNAFENNAQLLNAEYNKLVAEKDLELANSTYMPVIALNGSYGINGANNEVGNLLESRNTGLTGGVTLVYPIFQANQRKIRANNARVQYESFQELQLLAKDQLTMDLRNAWVEYEKDKTVLKMEESNLRNAEANFSRTRELYQIGKVTNTQFRDAQLNYLRAQVRIVSSKYEVRTSEFELLRLSGLLIQKK